MEHGVDAASRNTGAGRLKKPVADAKLEAT
jgi:hypothetical protein